MKILKLILTIVGFLLLFPLIFWLGDILVHSHLSEAVKCGFIISLVIAAIGGLFVGIMIGEQLFDLD